jgi:tripartite ATP-independent transporter DctM subunit
MLAGNLMNEGGITDDLVRFARLAMGHVSGGLGLATILASAIFAAISGSAVATAVAIGAVMLPAMHASGYDDDVSAAVTATAACMGPVIPPSIPFIIYGVLANVSIAALFLAGILPGVLLGLALMAYMTLTAHRRGYPLGERTRVGDLARGTVRALPALLMPVLIVGGILGGVFTPTEAAAVAVLYSLVAAVLIYRNVTLRDLYDALTETVKTTAILFLIVACAAIFSWVLSSERIPEQIARFLLGVSSNKYTLLLYVNLLLIVVGMWMESAAAIILFAPILAPIMVKVGIHPIHFAVTMILNLVIGLVTPPVGVVLYATCKVGEIRFEQLVKAMLPFILIAFAVLAVVSYVPETVLALPRLAGLIR